MSTSDRNPEQEVLVLQGGGALGAYQAGVFEGLCAGGVLPCWVAGISIGAINAAIIAGNPPQSRVERLREFWEQTSSAVQWPGIFAMEASRPWFTEISAAWVATFGVPGFFAPRFPPPILQPPGTPEAISFYDTGPLRTTLERLIDFDRINSPVDSTRLSVGAVNVRTGNFTYFDNRHQRIGPEHVMASGALPPALPAVKIDGELYWDGGIVSNTPLQHLLDQEPQENSLVFQVDLFSARGAVPRKMADVLARQKDIQFSSRTRQNTDTWARVHALQMKLLDALKRVPAESLSDEEKATIDELTRSGEVNIVHLIYQKKEYEGHAQDYEFSGASMREHWASGYADTLRTLRHPEWLTRSSLKGGIAIHDLHREDPT